MQIKDVLNVKGVEVATMRPDAPVRELVSTLAERRFGAMVIVDADGLVGIVSERDVVRGLAEFGVGVLDQPVQALMTEEVVTCEPSATVRELLGVMTDKRFRHIPVLVDGDLSGLVSIGDLVKSRIDELRAERDQLEAYIHA